MPDQFLDPALSYPERGLFGFVIDRGVLTEDGVNARAKEVLSRDEVTARGGAAHA